MDAIETARLKQLELVIPDIWDYKTYFYIGAGEYRHHYFVTMYSHKLTVDVVEINNDNCLWLLKYNPWIRSITCGDIRDPKLKVFSQKYDVVLWSHGIETIPKKDAHKVLVRLEQNKLVVHMTPIGNCGGYGNISVWYPIDFYRLQYSVNHDSSQINKKNSNIIAWKRNLV